MRNFLKESEQSFIVKSMAVFLKDILVVFLEESSKIFLGEKNAHGVHTLKMFSYGLYEAGNLDVH